MPLNVSPHCLLPHRGAFLSWRGHPGVVLWSLQEADENVEEEEPEDGCEKPFTSDFLSRQVLALSSEFLLCSPVSEFNLSSHSNHSFNLEKHREH